MNMNELAQEALEAAKRTIDDLAALRWSDMYSYKAVERAAQRVDVAAVADTLKMIVAALKAPVAEPVAWHCQDKLSAQYCLKDRVSDVDYFRSIGWTITPLYTHPAIASPESTPQVPAPSSQMAKDAARYQWLRSGNYPIKFARKVLNDTPFGIDEAIDAAMGAPTRTEARRPEQSDDRIAFEAWHRETFTDQTSDSDYRFENNVFESNPDVQIAWEGWQAALQSKEPK